MDLPKLAVGISPPWDINVVIEIPYNSDPVKHEVHKKAGVVYVGRFLHTAMRYPFNYGFIPYTVVGDGDPMDVVGRTPVISGAVIPADRSAFCSWRTRGTR
jgi:inorganic pyrophosphatase